MGPEAEMDAWLRGGGLVVTASDRAARAVITAYNRARLAEGLSAWAAPNVQDWKSFVRSAWLERACDGRLLLNFAQEQALWARIASNDRNLSTLLEGPRQRLAALAMEAHERLCSFAPRYLRESARSGWQQDAAAFSEWLKGFDELCRSNNLLSEGRLPLELILLLEAEAMPRPALMLAGFDRLFPIQHALFDAWGAWQTAPRREPATQIRFHAAADAQTELTACALWCSHRLAANPNAKLLVVTQDARQRRGEIERAFLKHTGAKAPGAAVQFEFSLGVPLRRIALAKGAHLLLRWLEGPLSEQEVDWLLSTGQIAVSEQEQLALQNYMRALRHSHLEEPYWSLANFLNQRPAAKLLPAQWAVRIKAVQSLVESQTRRTQTPLDWSALVPRLLESAGWPGWRPLSSAEFQAQRRWEQAVEVCGTLGFDGRRISWREFLDGLARALDETLFTPESRDATIQIVGPAESAGLTADAIWFLGASEEAWPATGSMHPMLPVAIQREAGMPHASVQLDWDLARSITERLLASASEVHFSYAKQVDAVEARPSRLVTEFAGVPQPLPAELLAPPAQPALTEVFEDWSRIPFPHDNAKGGADVLTAQSLCPFQAFATVRLGARSWEPAEAGLTAAQRGILLHAVLHAVWAGPPSGLRTHQDLLALEDRRSFVARHVSQVFRDKLSAALLERMPRRYLELEEQRLTRLVSEWLEYEFSRFPFEVAGTELAASKSIAGLTLDLRLDRVDRLNDDTLLVIDYKTGQVSPNVWNLPRPENVQLPLYARFALEDTFDEPLGGLVFARLRAGEMEFSGRVGDPVATLLPGLKGHSSLVRNQLEAEHLIDWENCIEQIAKDFLAGNAEVDPRDPVRKTCERCGLQNLCRIDENRTAAEEEDGPDTEEGEDE
jgi:ATP-dependent helicase/nuclease subunit B